MKLHHFLFLFLIFFLIATVIYSPSLSGPWQYDDYAQILDKQVLTGRSLSTLLSSTFRFTAHPDGWTGTRDLVRASFLLNWQWWGEKPLGYRWVNLTIHVINATLVTMLVALLLDRLSNLRNLRNLSILSGLLFLVHPANSQAVAYVAQRFTSMAAMFYLATVVLWLKAIQTKSSFIIHYSFSILMALLAFNSKEITVTLPVALLLVTLVVGRKVTQVSQVARVTHEKSGSVSRKLVLLLLPVLLVLPFFFIALKIPLQVISASTMGVGNIISQPADVGEALALKQKVADLTRRDYFLTQLHVVGTYLRLAVLPIRQTLDYDYKITKSLDPKTISLLALHIGLIGVGGWLLLGRLSNEKVSKVSEVSKVSKAPKKIRLPSPFDTFDTFGTFGTFSLIGFGLLWFYLTLLPESSIIPIADVIYEHRMYLPMVGLVVAAAAIAAKFYESYGSHGSYGSYVVLAATAWLLILSAATMRRAWVWGNEIRLWADVYAKAPNKARANKNYGVVMAASGKYDEGIARISKAIELDPKNADYWSNLGTAYLRSGQYDKASQKFIKAYDLYRLELGLPAYDSLSNLSNLSDLSNLDAKEKKQAAQYLNDYGVTLVQLNRGEEALPAFQKALLIDNTLYAARLGLGAAQNLLGDYTAAVDTFAQLVNEFPNEPDAYNNLAIVLTKAKRYKEALTVLTAFKRMKPTEPGIDQRLKALSAAISSSL